MLPRPGSIRGDSKLGGRQTRLTEPKMMGSSPIFALGMLEVG